MVRIAAAISALATALALGACTMPDAESFRAPDAAALFRPLSVTSYKDKVLPPVAAADLVDAGGQCAGAAPPAAANGEAVPMVRAVIALEMTECDVVKRAGIAEKVDLGTNERRERTATLTYINGQRPGIYLFTAGRLTSMERAPEPVVSAAPKKPAKRAAKPNAAKPGVSVQ